MPVWPPTASAIVVPEVSSMCHSATRPGWVCVACTTAVAAEVAVALPEPFVALTATRSVLPTSAATIR